MTKATAITAIEQLVVTVLLQSRKIQNFSSKVYNGFDQSAAHALKQKLIAVFNLPQLIPCDMDGLQAHTNPAF